MHTLIIDDEPVLRELLSTAVREGGHTADEAATIAEARAKLGRGDVDIALCDIKLPDGNGIDLLREHRASGGETDFVMVTAFASMETAVEALRAGASDFVTKPIHDAELLHRIAQIAELGGLREENRALRRTVRESAARFYRFTSPAMLEVERLVAKVAPTASTVLITGESGTGKGVVARAIHDASPRRDASFVAINCSAIPEQLLETEFFGHTKGAFTGASTARKGLFVQAERGTLFLDEIGDLPGHMQSKLLNVIEDKEVRAVGSEVARRVDTRIIAATNRDLRGSVRRGTFREDLYFRLSMFQIAIPPLREREGDIHGYLEFLLASGDSPRGPKARIDPLAEDVLLSYAWPGNVREFENVINRARILAEDNRIGIGDLPSSVLSPKAASPCSGGTAPAEGSLSDRVRQFESDAILGALEEAAGDRRIAARKLGIALSSLYRKLSELERE